MGLIDQIRDAGVVGAGGAGFPTDRKLSCKAEIFIVNGIECEPLLRTDRHVMELHAPEIVRTVRAIRDHLGAKRAVIALKKHYEGAVAALSAAVKGTKVELYLSDSFYPAGDEQNLVFSITGKTVPTGGIPLDVGCVVSNVSTVLNIAHAMEGTPVTDKLVTVGGAVARPVTVSAPIGTPLSKLLDVAGGAIGDCTFIVGGPLMGKLTDDLSQSVTKTTGGLLAIPRNHPIVAKKTTSPRDAVIARAACSQCSMCTQLCPRNAMGLNVQPHKAMRALASGNDTLIGDVNGIFSCCDSGLCTFFACNFGLKPNQAMQRAKAKLQSQGVKPVKEVKFEPDLVGDGLGLRFGIGLFGHTKHSSRHMFLTAPLFHDRGGKSIRPENLIRFRFTFVHRPMELFSFSTSSASGSSTTSRLTQPLRTLASVSTARS